MNPGWGFKETYQAFAEFSIYSKGSSMFTSNLNGTMLGGMIQL